MYEIRGIQEVERIQNYCFKESWNIIPTEYKINDDGIMDGFMCILACHSLLVSSLDRLLSLSLHA